MQHVYTTACKFCCSTVYEQEPVQILRLVSPLELLFYHGHVTRLQDFTAHTEQKLVLFRLTRPQSSLIISIWRGRLGARSIQPKFPEISVHNSMDRFGPTGKVSKKRVHLLRWTTFPGRTGWNFG